MMWLMWFPIKNFTPQSFKSFRSSDFNKEVKAKNILSIHLILSGIIYCTITNT